jgi:hypothetical protein
MNCLSHRDFARLIGALFGVAMGAGFALFLACLIFPPPDAGLGAASSSTLNWAKSWSRQEDREMAFYFLTLIFGGVLGYIGASRWFSSRQISLLAMIFLVVMVPAATLVIGASMSSGRLTAGLYSVAAIFVLSIAIWVMEKIGKAAPSVSTSTAATLASSVSNGRVKLSPVLAAAIAVVVMTTFVVPLRAGGIAAAIGFDMHMASFMVGPATYSFGESLLPGIDYFTQYSVGTPWLFSFFLAPTASQTMVNAVWFVLAEILFFQITLLFFLRWFFRSWAWALVMALACLLLQFTTSSPLYAPSSTSARHPLLIVSVAAFVQWVRHEFAWSNTLLLAAVLAASLFLNTETGIYTCTAAAITALVIGPGLVGSAVRVIALGALTFAIFMAWNVIAFGPGVLQVRYVLLLLEPLMLYSGGLGAWPIEWIGGYHWLYNIISPCLALATIGWVAASVRQATPPLPRADLAALAMIALVGLLFTAKFINMSIVGLWQVNSLSLVIVMAWWARALVEQLPEQRARATPFVFTIGSQALSFHWISPRAQASFGLALLLLLFLGTIEDPRNPSLYGIASYRTHPTLVNSLLGGPDLYPCPPERTGCSSTPVSPQDVALIDGLTTPKERVALLMMQDWTTLVEAKRASKFHFLPSAVVFTERQMRESLRDIDLIFLPREPAEKLGITHPDMEPILGPMLRTDFSVVAETPTLIAWRRVKADQRSDSTNETGPHRLR